MILPTKFACSLPTVLRLYRRAYVQVLHLQQFRQRDLVSTRVAHIVYVIRDTLLGAFLLAQFSDAPDVCLYPFIVAYDVVCVPDAVQLVSIAFLDSHDLVESFTIGVRFPSSSSAASTQGVHYLTFQQSVLSSSLRSVCLPTSLSKLTIHFSSTSLKL